MIKTDGYLSITAARLVAMDLPRIEEAVGEPLEQWGFRCHEISMKVLKTGLFGPGRIVRGWATGVQSQHSWIVLSADAYARDAVIVDPVLWSYVSSIPQEIYVCASDNSRYTPHGFGLVWDAGMPEAGDGPTFALAIPDGGWSREARDFLFSLGPLDAKGWMGVAHLPVLGWPAREIITAMYQDKRTRAFIPIDIVGHLTDENPQELYLP